MKDYKKYTDLDNTDNLVQQLLNLDCEMFIIEGTLNDTYLINTEHLQESHKLGRVKFRKYMILGHEFATHWSNNLYMQLTDNEELFEELYQEYEEQQKELDEWYSE